MSSKTLLTKLYKDWFNALQRSMEEDNLQAEWWWSGVGERLISTARELVARGRRQTMNPQQRVWKYHPRLENRRRRRPRATTRSWKKGLLGVSYEIFYYQCRWHSGVFQWVQNATYQDDRWAVAAKFQIYDLLLIKSSTRSKRRWWQFWTWK